MRRWPMLRVATSAVVATGQRTAVGWRCQRPPLQGVRYNVWAASPKGRIRGLAAIASDLAYTFKACAVWRRVLVRVRRHLT